MSHKNPSLLNLNRTLILLFVVLGQVSDGIQIGDYYFFAATVLWIWLPTCVKLETTVINYVTHANEDGEGSHRVTTRDRETFIEETSLH